MPSANGALSKLLCSCYHPKQDARLTENETADRYEVTEKDHSDHEEPKEKPRRESTAKVENRDNEDEKRSEKVKNKTNAMEQEVTTPIDEEIAEDQVCNRSIY
ncbi:unnamed protein product [Strongylus vulgaris]|uniref:Uncharacterized protein n=1 Tax=Strongylus vulgaris TaxID=40348 RepID=A0A3P7IPC5_STRVU|nr:unnamed protein product [Strongylus vulgaris]